MRSHIIGINYLQNESDRMEEIEKLYETVLETDH